jgi:hypothetical protein
LSAFFIERQNERTDPHTGSVSETNRYQIQAGESLRLRAVILTWKSCPALSCHFVGSGSVMRCLTIVFFVNFQQNGYRLLYPMLFGIRGFQLRQSFDGDCLKSPLEPESGTQINALVEFAESDIDVVKCNRFCL